MSKQREFTRDFKLKVLRELNIKKPIEICKEYNIHHSLLYKWKKAFEDNPRDAFSGKGNISRTEAIEAKYQRLLGKLYAENELLKKTMKRMQQLKVEQERVKHIK